MRDKTILLVEDQIEFRAIQKVYLEKQGYRVLAADNGNQAVTAAREHRPNIILMDFSMPEKDGLSATRELKSDPSTSHIPVILLTAHGYGSAGRRAREAGCAAFVPKPCDPWRVLQEVQQLIGPANERTA